MSEQPRPVFEQWLLAQAERDDPIGDVARVLAREAFGWPSWEQWEATAEPLSGGD